MPTYEYECKTCGHTFEVFQAMSDEPVKQCVKCGQEVRRLIFGGTGVIFKGSGFYVTDKAAGKSAAAKNKKPDNKKDSSAGDANSATGSSGASSGTASPPADNTPAPKNTASKTA